MNPDAVTRRIAICAFIGGLGGGLVFPILPALGLRLGIPAFMIGLILSGNRIARLIFNMPAGHLIGRLGPRLMLSMALLVESVGVLAYSGALHFGNAMWWLLGGRVLFGVGTAFSFVGAQAAVLSLSERADRGRRISVVRVAMSASMPAGLVFGGILADVFSDEAAFLAGAAIALVGAVFAALFLPPVSARSGTRNASSMERGALAALLTSPNLKFLVAAWGFNLLIFLTMQGALLATMVLLVQRRDIHMFGMQAQGTSGLLMAVLVGCSALVAYGIGRAIDAVPLRSTLLLPSLAGLACGFATLALAHTLWLALVGTVLVGVSYNGVTLPMLTLLGDVVSRRLNGPAVGVYQFFGDVGGTIGPIVGIEVGMNIGLMPLYIAIAVLPALAIPVTVWLRGQEQRLRAAGM
ncbi:MAG: MFS transporter [Pseudolabrys sp.]